MRYYFSDLSLILATISLSRKLDELDTKVKLNLLSIKVILLCSHVRLNSVLDHVHDLVHHGRLQAVSPGDASLPRQETANGHGLANLVTL